MFADKALRCECGYEVRASDEAARVDEVRRHASETHGIDLSADVALDVVRRVTARAEQRTEQRDGHLLAVAAGTGTRVRFDGSTDVLRKETS